jgi:Uma2 family endonuclease
MTTTTTLGIDFSTFPSSDGLPMAETEANADQMIDLMFALRHLLERIDGVHVAGNQLMYYNPLNGWDHISPDVYVATDVAPGKRESWKVWEEGKFPDIVFEIASPSTRGRDIGVKRTLYARLGVIEYYIFDPQGYLSPVFQPFHRSGDLLLPVQPGPDGRVSSTILPFSLQVVGDRLRAIDAVSGQLCATPDEEREARLTEQAARLAEQTARMAEHEARIAAETRAAAAESALRDALAALARQRNHEEQP